jgi:magnesium transporter
MTRLTQAGFDQNEQVKRLTSIAAMLYAPTVVAAIYGMNFDHMPELHWAFGYPYALGVMVLLGLVLWGIFRWRRWL